MNFFRTSMLKSFLLLRKPDSKMFLWTPKCGHYEIRIPFGHSLVPQYFKQDDLSTYSGPFLWRLLEERREESYLPFSEVVSYGSFIEEFSLQEILCHVCGWVSNDVVLLQELDSLVLCWCKGTKHKNNKHTSSSGTTSQHWQIKTQHQQNTREQHSQHKNHSNCTRS